LKILVIGYSQTGQLDQIVDNITARLKNVEIDRVKLAPKTEFEFPWSKKSFFDAMPETVLEEPIELKPLSLKHSKYDLIILAYQPWFLSPSLPSSSLLQLPDFLSVLKDTDVVTVVGSRNMWINSQDSITKRIKNAGGRLVGNIPFIDRNQNHISAVTILHWMLTGKKTRKYNIFPFPGVSDKDIGGAAKFGDILNESIQKRDFSDLQDKVLATGEIKIGTDVLFIEERAKKLFLIWANLIKKKGTSPKLRRRWIYAFSIYLSVALFVISPIVLILYYVLFMPFVIGSINKRKNYICSVNK